MRLQRHTEGLSQLGDVFQNEQRGGRLEEDVPVSGCGLFVPSWWQESWGWSSGIIAGPLLEYRGGDRPRRSLRESMRVGGQSQGGGLESFSKAMHRVPHTRNFLRK